VGPGDAALIGIPTPVFPRHPLVIPACHFVIPAKAGIHDDGSVMEKHPAVYILASKRNGTLYTGVTSDLVRRVWEHREGLGDGFTARYGVKRLVYFEAHEDMYTAITREKQIKEWRRRWKVELIEGMNPEWRDLWETIVGGEPETQPVIPA
jgi:putative endonuclease